MFHMLVMMWWCMVEFFNLTCTGWLLRIEFIRSLLIMCVHECARSRVILSWAVLYCCRLCCWAGVGSWFAAKQDFLKFWKVEGLNSKTVTTLKVGSLISLKFRQVRKLNNAKSTMVLNIGGYSTLQSFKCSNVVFKGFQTFDISKWQTVKLSKVWNHGTLQTFNLVHRYSVQFFKVWKPMFKTWSSKV